MRISDWSSDVCSSDLEDDGALRHMIPASGRANMKKILLAAVAALALTGAQSPPSNETDTPLSLWRLDCGTLDIDDLGVFSDTGLYAGQKKDRKSTRLNSSH